MHEIKAHDTYLLKCVLSPNVEKLVTTSADKTVKVWDTKTWTHQRTLVSCAALPGVFISMLEPTRPTPFRLYDPQPAERLLMSLTETVEV